MVNQWPQGALIHDYHDLVAGLLVPPPDQPNGQSGPPDPDRVCGDGERTRHLTKLAGLWIGRGLDIEYVVQLAQDWNSKNNPPLDDGKVEDTCRSILKTHQRKNPGDANDDKPLFDLASASIARLLKTEPAPREWLLEGCLPLGKSAALVAPGGSSKSQLALQLGVSVATGIPLCGQWTVPKVGSALLLFAEEDEDEIQRRLHTTVDALAGRGYRERLAELEKRLFIKSMLGEDNLLTKTNRSGELERTSFVDRLLKTVAELEDLRLIVIDPASRFRGGEENSNEDATRFVEGLERLAKPTGATVLIVHHARKGGAEGGRAVDSARGASALSDGVRWVMQLRQPTKDEAKNLGIDENSAWQYVYAQVTKTNYSPPQGAVLLHRQEGGYLDVVPGTGTLVTPEDREMADVIDTVLQHRAQITRTKFVELYGGETSALKLGELKVRRHLNKCVDDGLIKAPDRKPMLVTAPGFAFRDDVRRRQSDGVMPSAHTPSSAESDFESET